MPLTTPQPPEAPSQRPVPEPAFPHFFDSSSVDDARLCDKKFYYSSILNQVLRGTNPHLNAGSAYADALETFRRLFYAEGKTKDEALQAAVLTCIRSYGDYDPPDTEKLSVRSKTWDRVCAAVCEYVHHYPPEFDHARPAIIGGKVAAEFSFAVPLPLRHPVTNEPLLYAGRFDSAMRVGGQGFDPTVDYSVLPLFGEDDKTTYQMGPQWSEQWDLRGQLIGYAWAARTLGFRFDGFLVRGAAIQMRDIKHSECVLHIPSWKIDEWYQDTLLEIQHQLQAWKNAYWKKAWGSACTMYGGCPYSTLCNSQHPDSYLQTHYETRFWNPVQAEKGT